MAPAVPLSVQPSLSELLGLHVFQGSRLLAGHGCLERGVSGVNLSDTPEYYKWLPRRADGDHLLLHTQ